MKNGSGNMVATWQQRWRWHEVSGCGYRLWLLLWCSAGSEGKMGRRCCTEGGTWGFASQTLEGCMHGYLIDKAIFFCLRFAKDNSFPFFGSIFKYAGRTWLFKNTHGFFMSCCTTPLKNLHKRPGDDPSKFYAPFIIHEIPPSIYWWLNLPVGCAAEAYTRFQDITWQLIPEGSEWANVMGFNVMCRRGMGWWENGRRGVFFCFFMWEW